MKVRSPLTASAAFVLIAVAAYPANAGTGNAPPDPAAARQEITRAFEAWAALSTADEVAANLDLIDDPRGVVEAARQAQQTFPYEVSHDRNVVHEVRFVSPTKAVVTYDILIDGSRDFFGRTGHAVLRDGKWKLTRDTVCGNLALAEGNCGDPLGSRRFELVIPAIHPSPATATARSVTPCPQFVISPSGSTPIRYFARVTNAPPAELPLEGGPWSTEVDLRKFGDGTHEVRAECVLQQGDVSLSPLTYRSQSVTLDFASVPGPPSPPRAIPARPAFTG